MAGSQESKGQKAYSPHQLLSLGSSLRSQALPGDKATLCSTPVPQGATGKEVTPRDWREEIGRKYPRKAGGQAPSQEHNQPSLAFHRDFR